MYSKLKNWNYFYDIMIMIIDYDNIDIIYWWYW